MSSAARPSGNPLLRWFDRTVLSLGRELRWSYLPPLMVYVAAGVSGLTGIVGTFFVKDYLGLSAAFLAALGFWAGIPWALKMPLGHLVDLIWRWKAALVWLGAAIIASSLLIMVGLIAHTEAMVAIASKETWYVIAALLAQGLAPFDAARLGVWVHGRAGDIAAHDLGEISMTARDLVDRLSRAWRDATAPRSS